MIVVEETLSAVSPAAPGTGLGTSNVGIAGDLADADALIFYASLVGATGGTLDVYIQHLVNGVWLDYVHFTQLAAGAAASKAYFAVTKAQAVAVATNVGNGTTPSLPAGTVVGGPWGSQLRLLFTAGASTSAGATISIAVTGLRAAPLS
jgi:hypothetical protein